MSRAQAIGLGLSDAAIRAQLLARRWQGVYPGIYATFTGKLSDRARVWAAILYAGEGAVASHRTAQWLQGMTDAAPRVIDVMVPASRRVVAQPGLRIRTSKDLPANRHPVRSPPQTRVEETVLDLIDEATSPEAVIDVVIAACQRGATTASRISRAAARRRRLRWRRLLGEILSDVRDGALSPLERRWRRDVEVAHRLPRGERNRPEQQGRRRRYRDVRYRPWNTVVELDGRAVHPDGEAHRDMERDNELAVEGASHLRYGWRDVAGRPCHCAGQLAKVLTLRGWRGTPRACGPDCGIVSEAG